MTTTIHYGENREEFASRAGKHPSCFDNRLRALCGNGDYHAPTTRTAARVTCPACLERMPKRKSKPGIPPARITSFIFKEWHAWTGEGDKILLSDETVQKLRCFDDVDGAVNWLYLAGEKDAARALNAHAKEVTK